MIAALLLGISYGFAAGISPGPLLALVITQTLKRGWRAGNLIALAVSLLGNRWSTITGSYRAAKWHR